MKDPEQCFPWNCRFSVYLVSVSTRSNHIYGFFAASQWLKANLLTTRMRRVICTSWPAIPEVSINNLFGLDNGSLPRCVGVKAATSPRMAFHTLSMRVTNDTL